MEHVITIAGLLAIGGGLAYAVLRMSRRDLPYEIEAFAATVPAPLTDDVRRWLEPQFARRDRYPTFGLLFGITVVHIVGLVGEGAMPWDVFPLVLGIGAGMVGGGLVAGYRTVPLVEGPTRIAEPVERRVSTHFTPARVTELRLAVAIVTLSMAFAVALATTTVTVSTTRALVGCGVATFLVLAHYGMVALLVRRPMSASSPEGLAWQKALLAKTVDHIPFSALYVALFSAGVVAFVLIEEVRALPVPLVIAGVGFLVMVVASSVPTLLRERQERQRSRMVTSGSAPT